MHCARRLCIHTTCLRSVSEAFLSASLGRSPVEETGSLGRRRVAETVCVCTHARTQVPVRVQLARRLGGSLVVNVYSWPVCFYTSESTVSRFDVLARLWRRAGLVRLFCDVRHLPVLSLAWRLECVASAGFRPRSSPAKLAAVKRNICVSRVLLSADFVTVANRFHCGHGVC